MKKTIFLETTGLEPVTPCLQSRYSTFELRPPSIVCYKRLFQAFSMQ